MPVDQKELLTAARKLGQAEREAAKLQRQHDDAVERANKLRDALFANLAGTGTPEERQKAIMGLLAQVASEPQKQPARRERAKVTPLPAKQQKRGAKVIPPPLPGEAGDGGRQ